MIEKGSNGKCLPCKNNIHIQLIHIQSSAHMSEDIQTALLTRSELEWLLGKRQLSKPYERKMRAIINKKLRTWEQQERPLLEAQGFLAATISSSGATTGSSGIGHYPDCTVRSSIVDDRVPPLEREQEPEVEEFIRKCSGRDLNPGSATRKAAMLDRTVQPYQREDGSYTTGAFANPVRTFT
jgi:hypothetical protein